MRECDVETLRRAVAESVSIAGVIRILGLSLSGSVYAKLKTLIRQHGLSTVHFTGQGHHRGRPAVNRKSADEILRPLPEGSRRTKREQLFRALSEKNVSYECAVCGTGAVWRGKRLVLEIDHLSGDWRDNRLENLRYLCPSCHSQTPTYSCSRVKATRRAERGG